MRLLTSCLALAATAVLAAGCGPDGKQDAYTGVLEGTSIRVPALTGGRIIRLPVAEGQPVAPGDTLAVVDTESQRLQIQQLEASLEELEAQMAIARTDIGRTEADLAYLRQKQARVRSLVETHAAPEQNLDDVSNRVQEAEAAHSAARQQLGLLGARRKQVEAGIRMVRKQIADAVVTAPEGGLLATRYYEPGEAVPPLQPVCEIVHIARLKVRIYVAEPRLPDVRHGQAAAVRADGLDTVRRGRVAWVSPKAEFTPKQILTPETRTSLVYAVEVTVENPDGALKDGMPVEVTLGDSVASSR